MDRKYLLLILTIIILIFVVIGLAIQLQGAKKVNPIMNNTTNNTSANITVEHINNETVQQSDNQQSSGNGNQVSQSDNQASQSGMPEETRRIYAARERAAQDGIPMYEYVQSPELVERYQSMV